MIKTNEIKNMRTAITTAVTHEGNGVLISGKEVSLLDQQKAFRLLKGLAVTSGAHEKYASVSYQENDGVEELLRFRTPLAQKEHDARRASERQEQEKYQAAAAAENKPNKPGQNQINTDDPDKGPTVAEYVAAGYDPKKYPPQGFNSKSTAEEIAKAIADFKPKSNGNQQTAQEPDGLKGKTDEELRKVILKLAGPDGKPIQLKPNETRDELVTLIIQATEGNKERKEPGFFGRLFGAKA